MTDKAIPRKVKTIKVKAVGLGETNAWYGLQPGLHRLIKQGDVFDIWEEDFSKRWMERVVEPPKAAAPVPTPAALPASDPAPVAAEDPAPVSRRRR